ncbi:MAG: hypothetical protein NZ811_04690 [Gammaproteobacteria bacterium]|nr:hypothetical protein [Gammaproteobacteria bacterium]
MKTNTSLELAVPLDVLLTPENITQERIVDILKGSNHYYFNDTEIDIETGISYNMGGYFIRHASSQSVIQAFTFDRLKNEISNAELLKLINMVGSNYFMINSLIYDERHLKESQIGIRSHTEIVIRGGISETALVESIKLFTSEYVAMRAMYMEQHLYVYDEED